jgi:indolepyruvate ferredoxin oxidoreductase beta subunit
VQYNIILCGVGGQGILFLSKFFIQVAMKAGLNAKQSEIHGMAQRGGSVFAHIRLSDGEIYSPLIPENCADMIISMEPLEIYRYTKFINKNTKLIVNSTPFKNINNYPDEEKIISVLKENNAYLIDNASNITLAGCASKFLPIAKNVFDEVLSELSKKSQEMYEKNKADFEKGQNYDL